VINALLPLKDLVSAKTRLSGVLSPSERRALAQAMVEDVLATLTSHPQISSVTLVSDDPGADLLAGKYGIDFLDERRFTRRGLNPVLETACDLSVGTQGHLTLILHGDIPLLSHTDIDLALARMEEVGGLVIGCDRLGLGTNLLLFNADSRPTLHFGADSCEKHANSARAGKIAVSVLRTAAIGLDVDEPADLVSLLKELPQRSKSKTAQLLLDTPLSRRIDRQAANAIGGADALDNDEIQV